MRTPTSHLDVAKRSLIACPYSLLCWCLSKLDVRPILLPIRFPSGAMYFSLLTFTSGACVAFALAATPRYMWCRTHQSSEPDRVFVVVRIFPDQDGAPK